MRDTNCIVLSAVDTGNATGDKIDAQQLFSGSFVINFGDVTANGTVKIQASNDICPFGSQAYAFTPTNWGDIPNAAYTTASGGSGVILVPHMAFRWMRAVYVRNSGGSSTITVTMNSISF